MWDMALGIWRIGEILDVDAQIDWIEAAGYEAISFHASPGDPDIWRGIDPSATSAEERFRLRARLASFSRVEIHAPYSAVITPEGATDAVKALEPVIEFAGDLRATILTVHAIPDDANPDTTDWVAALERLDRLAGSAGITIGLENIRPTWYRGPRLSHLGVTLDVGHLHDALIKGLVRQTPADAVRSLGDALVGMHVHDHDGQLDHLAPGAGQIEWPTIFRALDEVSFGGFLVVELDPDRVSPEEMRRSRNWLAATAAEASGNSGP